MSIAVENSRIVPQPSVFPRWWRLVLIALSSLILTACSAIDPPRRNNGSPMMAGGPRGAGISAMPSRPMPTSQVPPGMMPTRNGVQLASANFPIEDSAAYSAGSMEMCYGVPQPIAGCPSCAANGMACDACGPGPRRIYMPDEYVCDGGDRDITVRVAPDFHISGLDPEDTVAHYDTLDGKTVVEPTNRVCVYSPRFAAVRKVDPLVLNQQNEQAIGAHSPTPPILSGSVQLATTTLQDQQLQSDITAKRPILLRERSPSVVLINELSPRGFQDRFKPYEDLALIRTGIGQQDENAYLAQKTLAAIVWTKTQGAQVLLDNKMAQAVTKDESAQTTYTVDLPGNPKLRVCKIASTDLAQTGETIDFTIRYDNIGNQKIGNVTIVDSLTTRLEYVPESAQSSKKSNFSTKANEADSLILRWEITDPLEPGQGGILRFRCKVR